MMKGQIIPQSYEAWHHCITVECGLELTADYVSDRIASLQDERDHHTQQFVKCYGRSHRDKVLAWFFQAQRGL